MIRRSSDFDRIDVLIPEPGETPPVEVYYTVDGMDYRVGFYDRDAYREWSDRETAGNGNRFRVVSVTDHRPILPED